MANNSMQIQALLTQLNLFWDQVLEARHGYYNSYENREKQIEWHRALERCHQQFSLCWDELSRAGHWPCVKEGGGFQ